MRDSFENQRTEMIQFLKQEGIHNAKVLAAMKKVPRERFVPEEQLRFAYQDTALPIGFGATISQPLVIATILDALELKKGQRILEVGSGSGYVLALLKQIVRKEGIVVGMEIIPELVVRSKKILLELQYDVIIFKESGKHGKGGHGPYDRILLSCACEQIPDVLFDQLTNDGIIIAPVGVRFQILTKYKKKNTTLYKETLGFVRFVTLR